MRQTMIHLYARAPGRAAIRAKLLSPLRLTPSSPHTPLSTHLTSHLQRRPQHHAFHVTFPHHRKPPSPSIKPAKRMPGPPIRVVKRIPPPPKPEPPPPPPNPPGPPPPPPKQPSPPGSSSSGNGNSGNNNSNKQKEKDEKLTPNQKILTEIVIIAFFLVLLSKIDPAKPLPLNPEKFTHFTVTAREQVSPTAFVLTVEPAAAAPTPAWLAWFEWFEWPLRQLFGGKTSGDVDAESARDTAAVVRAAWGHGLWAVEVKQPELQVAREYTPLPAGGGGDGDGGGREGEEKEEGKADDAKLRLYVRKMGEVSGYLDRLKVGDKLELRGPRLGFDLKTRVGGVESSHLEAVTGDGVASLGDQEGVGAHWEGTESHGKRETVRGGDKKKVVFLAGGTGIAPALQAAEVLLGTTGVDMELVWANRRREDCQIWEGLDGGGKPGAVVALLEKLRRQYAGRFSYICTVDEEGSFIDAGTVTQAMQRSTSPAPSSSALAPAPGQSSWGMWSAEGTGQTSNSPSQVLTASVNSEACSYHSAKKLAWSDHKDADSVVGSSTELCQCVDNYGNAVTGGKNLLMVSGPDGFINHFVGPKVWASGKELQGPVKGVIGDLWRKYPSYGENWLVLKM